MDDTSFIFTALILFFGWILLCVYLLAFSITADTEQVKIQARSLVAYANIIIPEVGVAYQRLCHCIWKFSNKRVGEPADIIWDLHFPIRYIYLRFEYVHDVLTDVRAHCHSCLGFPFPNEFCHHEHKGIRWSTTHPR